MKKKIKYICILLLMSIMLLGACTNSGASDNSGVAFYKTFTMDEGIARFSFEYPTHFKMVGYNADDEEELSYVHLKGPVDKVINDYPSMGIAVWSKRDYTAKDYLDNTLESFIDLPDYELMERSEVTVSGVTGNLIAYKHRNIQPIDRGLDEPLIEVHRIICFEFSELIWKIDLRSDSSTAEVDKADFQHVVDTFKILE